jgi:hypothetical protein
MSPSTAPGTQGGPAVTAPGVERFQREEMAAQYAALKEETQAQLAAMQAQLAEEKARRRFAQADQAILQLDRQGVDLYGNEPAEKHAEIRQKLTEKLAAMPEPDMYERIEEMGTKWEKKYPRELQNGKHIRNGAIPIRRDEAPRSLQRKPQGKVLTPEGRAAVNRFGTEKGIYDFDQALKEFEKEHPELKEG